MRNDFPMVGTADPESSGTGYVSGPGRRAKGRQERAVPAPAQPRHPFLEHRLTAPQPTWRSSLERPCLDYLKDHRVSRAVVFPGAGYVEAGLAIHQALQGQAEALLEDLRFHRPMILEDEARPLLELEYDEASAGYAVFSRPRDSAVRVLHATGRLVHTATPSAPQLALLETRKRCRETMEVSALYSQMRARGLQYGPRFQGVRQVWCSPGEVLARIQGLTGDDHHLHPIILDAAFQSLLAAPELAATAEELYLPVRIQRLYFHARPDSVLWCHGRVQGSRRGVLQGDLTLYDNRGRVLAQVQGLHCLRSRQASAA